MRLTRLPRLVALLLALAMIAAACSDDGDGEVTEGGAETAGEAEGEEGGEEAAEGEGEGGDEVVMGQDPDDELLYHGTGDFTLDLADCPPDYDPSGGITEDKITWGISLPKAGPFAGFGALADGAKAYFDDLNANGGIDGRMVELIIKDDAYEPARTRANVQEFLADPNIAGLFMTLGTPNNLAVWDEVNEQCIPQLLNATGAGQWGDVEGHPWTTGMQIDYFTEALLWGRFLEQQYPDGVQVATIVMNNDFGRSYQAGFQEAVQGTNIEIVEEVLHDPAAPNLDNEITTLAATGAEVLVIQTSGAFCTQLLGGLARSEWDPFVVMSATCGAIGSFLDPLNPPAGGEHPAEGVTIVANYLDVTDPAYADLDIVKQYEEVMTAAGYDPEISTYGTGWIFAMYLEDIMRRAAELNGGLNRPNILIAARSQDYEHPMFVPDAGLTGRMSGAEDAYLTEGGIFRQFTFQDGQGSYVDFPGAEPINLEGEAGNWQQMEASMED